jgi:histidyl-tRNA synthetase
MASTNPARGMRDFLPSDVRKRNYVIGIIKEVYESYGFEPLETPAVENIETLMGKYGDEGNQLIFKILKRGEKLRDSQESGVESLEQETPSHDSRLTTQDSLSDLALRYDLTVPLARVVANNKNDLPKFFKRYQIQPVWRADRPARGRFREFYQCDVDCIGSGSMVIEAELISAVAKILKRLKFRDFVIRINDRLLLDAVMTICQIADSDQGQVIVALDKLDKIGIDGVKAELKAIGIEENSTEALMSWTTKKVLLSGNLEALDFSESSTIQEATQFLGQLYSNGNFLPQTDEGKVKLGRAITRLQSIITNLSFIDEQIPIRIDPSLARGLSYYTGTIMEINVEGIGSLGGGGRYDGLIGMFGKEQIPACGFSLGLERILVVMDERNMFPAEVAATSADVMVTIWNEETIGESLKLASELRQQGLRVVVYPEADKLGKQIKYADTINVSFVCIIGDEEVSEHRVKLKDMASGEEWKLTAAEIAKKITT